jgi:hypothetical protein
MLPRVCPVALPSSLRSTLPATAVSAVDRRFDPSEIGLRLGRTAIGADPKWGLTRGYAFGARLPSGGIGGHCCEPLVVVFARMLYLPGTPRTTPLAAAVIQRRASVPGKPLERKTLLTAAARPQCVYCATKVLQAQIWTGFGRTLALMSADDGMSPRPDAVALLSGWA